MTVDEIHVEIYISRGTRRSMCRILIWVIKTLLLNLGNRIINVGFQCQILFRFIHVTMHVQADTVKIIYTY
jgi:hypothetical protein